MSEFFPKSKAKVTSIYMMMGGVANFLIPLITGYLSTIGLQYIILLDFAFALLTFITAIIVFIRYYRVFKSRKTMSDLASIISSKNVNDAQQACALLCTVHLLRSIKWMLPQNMN